MREKVTLEKLNEFMRRLAAASRSPGKVYLTGGATALLLGFREQTIDIDLKLDPEPAGAFEAIADLKNRLNVNVELAAPDDFIPRTPDWQARSQHIGTFGQVQFFHYDFSLQALAKLERGHEQDLRDVTNLLGNGHVTVGDLIATLRRIEPNLVRYPAIDPEAFKEKVDSFLQDYARQH